ncbi:MAG: 2-amino-4-hydroxy-6-hydroxymethyldihydropteridine diphosphokinase [Pseudomonadales bacterium]|nr:2-amino-4-hydroxy-6-hydroxymethyldihydropteridine diphosphokinase [Halioglobus sp.]MCP5123481.1 2-amino-4-hydroxy-6-hydroxymethyldihydropteridine diphosphokinase [Pseudomonadales bacterium]MCP5193681.1 2-amino-4-hydroxy-6-hydroxymethyldihydropteridine diphosphokinase [Pseudomonadales bacterium]
MTTAFIGLGSNLQDPLRQLRKALLAIAQLPGTAITAVSSAYRSAAVGPGVQPDYLNAVLRLETSLEPVDLLGTLQGIELAQGRVRTVHWGARSLDLDILLYGDRQLATPRLTIPHPALAQRNFVLYPLADVAGLNWVLPDGTDLGTLIARCPRGDLVKTGQRLIQDDTVPGDVE